MENKIWRKINILIAVGLVWAPVFVAQANYQDEELSENNNIGATSLDAEVSSAESEWQDATTAGDLLPGETVTRSAKIKNVGGLDFQYKIAFEKIAGNDDLCSALQLTAKKGTVKVWEGNLSDFGYEVGLLMSGGSDDWDFSLTLPENSGDLSSLDCKFKFVWTAWQTDFVNPNKGWVDNEEFDNTIHTGIEAPVQTGYNEDNGDSPATPRDPNEIPCQGGYTNINGISIHWTNVGHNNPKIKYQRQYKKVGAYDWRGSEIYTNPYTNYRTFGGNPGDEATYGSRVRAWADENGNNKIDAGETVSDWSNECSITYDITPPAKPTGLRRIAPNENNKVYSCGDISKIQKMWPDWNDNTESDFDHYEYTSFNAPNGAIGLNEKIFYDSIFKYNGSWLPKDGTYGFAVRAVDKAGNKSEWALGGSKTLADSCQITYDSTAPEVEVTNLDDGDFVSGKVDIRGTVTDAHPHHYWLVVQDKHGHKVAGPGVVNETDSFTDKSLYKWDTTKVPDGEYVIKLEARDALGNKDPDQAPISSDPEKSGDSVDWVDVTVDNTAPVISDEFFEMSTREEKNPTPNDPKVDLTITWKTDEPATSVVEWGKTKSYGNIAELPEDTSADKTEHKVIIKDFPVLEKETYHFRIKSVDRAGNTTYSKDEIVKVEGVTGHSCNFGSPVVLNEFMPNPVGSDNASKPKGEWVELYNKSNKKVDLKDWFLADANWLSGHHSLKITSANTNTGDTEINSKGHLVVYRNGNSGSFSLNNGGDILMLVEKVKISWTGSFGKKHEIIIPVVRDLYAYKGKDVVEGKSFARFPDGGSVWIDPEATPGGDNKLSKKELRHFRKYTLDKCFKKDKLKKHTKDELCDKEFLVYLGMLKNVDGKKLALKHSLINGKKTKDKKDKKVKDKKKKEEKKKDDKTDKDKQIQKEKIAPIKESGVDLENSDKKKDDEKDSNDAGDDKEESGNVASDADTETGGGNESGTANPI